MLLGDYIFQIFESQLYVIDPDAESVVWKRTASENPKLAYRL
jgi:hypothetical protein